jgi:hypothetical protein
MNGFKKMRAVYDCVALHKKMGMIEDVPDMLARSLYLDRDQIEDGLGLAYSHGWISDSERMVLCARVESLYKALGREYK